MPNKVKNDDGFHYNPTTFTCDNKLTLDLMDGRVKILYDWNYTGLVQDNNDEDDNEEDSDSDAGFVIDNKDNDEKSDNPNYGVIVLE